MDRNLVRALVLALLLGPAVVLTPFAAMFDLASDSGCLGGFAADVPSELQAEYADGTRIILDHTQLTHAHAIVTIGQQTDGVGREGIAIALMAGLTESGLRMLSNTGAYPESASFPNDGDGSDHDSLGIFQMRPDAGWGTVAQLMDPAYQVRAFFGGPTGPNAGSPRGLLDISGWQQLDPGAAAQAVEVSAYPDRYANAQPVAEAIITAVTAPGDSSVPSSGLGAMPSPTAIPAPLARGILRTANANLRNPRTTGAALRLIQAATAPDFITLNEVDQLDTVALRRMLPGYDAVKGADRGDAQAAGNAILWRRDRWRLLDAGMVMIVQDDQAVFRGHRVSWDRFAVWGVFEHRDDSSTVPVISTHHMTNVRRMPRQWGNPPMTRAEQYDLGMDHLLQLAAVLEPYGPVLLGGDMNSHASDGPFAAVPRMSAGGFDMTKDRGVMYQFFPNTVQVLDHRELAVPSDHPANLTTLLVDRPTETTFAPPGGAPAGCPPCPPAAVIPVAGATTAAPSYDLGPVSPALTRLVEILGPMFGITSVGGYRPSARDPLGHPSGNAADFMVPSDASGWASPAGRVMGDQLAAYAQAHAAELHVDYIIWWQRIWSLDRADEGWRPMDDRGSHNENHRNHVHINVEPGAAADAVAAPCAPVPASG